MKPKIRMAILLCPLVPALWAIIHSPKSPMVKAFFDINQSRLRTLWDNEIKHSWLFPVRERWILGPARVTGEDT